MEMITALGFAVWENLNPASMWDYISHTLVPLLFDRLALFINAPLIIPEMLWIVIPLTFTLLIIEFYFGRYPQEALGWNTAVGNSLVLVFVSLDLFRLLFGSLRQSVTIYLLYFELKVIIATFIMLQGVLMLYANFFHKISKRMSFFISSALPVNLLAYVGIVIIYTNIPIDFYSIAAAVLLFGLLYGVFGLLHLLEQKFLKAPGRPTEKLNIPVVESTSKPL